MFPTFDELMPLFEYMFSQGSVKIFMTDLCENSQCHIPTLPFARCDAASIEIRSIQILEDCYRLQSEGARIKQLRVKTPAYSFYLNYSARYAMLKTRSTAIVTLYRDIIRQVPGLVLRVVMPAQN
jgi:hypothetical protein